MISMDLHAVARFWNFVIERQRVWHARHILQQRPPWTSDPILRSGHFTNVYRELDPGTRFAVELLTRDAPLEERVLNVMVYRLIGREDTMRALGWIGLPFRPAEFREKLEALRERKLPVFGGAYMVNSYAAMGWGDKILNVTALLRKLTEERWAKFWERFQGWSGVFPFSPKGDREQLHAVLCGEYGWGRFLAFQVLVDLCYPLPDPTFLGPVACNTVPLSNYNSWATAGPGTLRGLRRIWPHATQGDADGLMALLECSTEAVDTLVCLPAPRAEGLPAILSERCGLWLAQGARVGRLFPIPLSRANIANCLCEWDKYEKARLDEARVGRQFNERRSWLADLEARGHGAQLELIT